MIIEQHITTPPGYISARVITFRGLPEEEMDAPEDRAIGKRPEPAWEKFVGHVLKFAGTFTSEDVPGFTVHRASRYMTRAVERGVIRQLPVKIQRGKGRPKNVYEVAR